MRRIRKKFKNPRRPWDMEAITENKKIKSKYGLRRKKEILIAQGILRDYRQRARELIALKDDKKEKILIEKLAKIGLLPPEAGLDNVLGLGVENILDRRVQTVVHKKGLSKTPKQARQFIVHRNVLIGNRTVKFPSYIVSIDEEKSIKLKNPDLFKREEPKDIGVVARPPVIQHKPPAPAGAKEPVKEQPKTEVKK